MSWAYRYFAIDLVASQLTHQNGFNMQSCSSSKAPIVKGGRFSKGQCPHNDIERDRMKAVPYYSIVSSLMYAQVCTHADIAFVVGVLGRYLSDPGQSHWKAAKKVLGYL